MTPLQAAEDEAMFPPDLVFRESDITVGRLLGAGSYGEVKSGSLRGRAICIKVRTRFTTCFLPAFAVPGRSFPESECVVTRSTTLHC